MKISAINPGNTLLAILLAASGTLTSLASPSMAAAAGEAGKSDNSFISEMEKWQEKMSQEFRDTWKSLRGQSTEPSVSAAAVDLREQKGGYTLRLDLPGRDLSKVGINLEGGLLRIVAPAEDKIGRYEQSVELPGVGQGAKPKVERNQQDSLIVITVPKSKAAANATPSPGLPARHVAPLSDWDREIVARMEKMQRDMNRVFGESFQDFKLAPEYKGFFDEPRFGSSVDLKQEGGNYVVRAYLPDRDMQHVNVTLEGQTLRIEAKEQEATTKEDKSGALQSRRESAYSQLLALPGPVQSDKMKVERKEGMLVVTIPKAATK